MTTDGPGISQKQKALLNSVQSAVFLQKHFSSVWQNLNSI